MSKKLAKFVRGLGIVWVIIQLVNVPVVAAKDLQMLIADSEGGLQAELANAFAKRVGEVTQGRINILVSQQDSLFQDDQVFGAVKNNLVPVGSRLISALAHESKLFQLDSLPYLARNYTQAFKLYKAAKEDLERVLRIKGVKLLFAVPWPAQGIYSRVKLESLTDLKGLSFRPYSQLTSQFGQRLGMKQRVISLTDFEKKLARNSKNPGVDVIFGSALAAQSYQLSSAFRYWYDLNAWLPKEMTVINLSVWEKLGKEDQKLILQAAKDIESEGWVKSNRAQESARQFLLDSGVKVQMPSPELEKGIEVAAVYVLQSWLADVGDAGRHIWERYMQL